LLVAVPPPQNQRDLLLLLRWVRPLRLATWDACSRKRAASPAASKRTAGGDDDGNSSGGLSLAAEDG
jgi:hypothetical protein